MLSISGLGSLQAVNAALKVGHEITGITLPEFRLLPVVASDGAAAIGGAAVTFKFIKAAAIAHGIVKTDFFAGTNGAHCFSCIYNKC